MSKCVMLIASAEIPAGKRHNFSWTWIRLWLTPPPHIQWLFKHHQRTTINKTVLSAYHSFVFDSKFTVSVLKSKYIFHPNGNWTRATSVGNLNWVSLFYASPSQWFWMQLSYLTLITTTLCLTTNGESLKVSFTHL